MRSAGMALTMTVQLDWASVVPDGPRLTNRGEIGTSFLASPTALTCNPTSCPCTSSSFTAMSLTPPSEQTIAASQLDTSLAEDVAQSSVDDGQVNAMQTDLDREEEEETMNAPLSEAQAVVQASGTGEMERRAEERVRWLCIERCSRIDRWSDTLCTAF